MNRSGVLSPTRPIALSAAGCGVHPDIPLLPPKKAHPPAMAGTPPAFTLLLLFLLLPPVAAEEGEHRGFGGREGGGHPKKLGCWGAWLSAPPKGCGGFWGEFGQKFGQFEGKFGRFGGGLKGEGGLGAPP